MNGKVLFFKRDSGKIVPVVSKKLNKKAKLKIQNLLKIFADKLPKKILKNSKHVKLFHPDGNLAKAESLLINPNEGAFSLKNKLNELTGKEWIKFTSSWFIFNAVRSDLKEERNITEKFKLNSDDHPATYSPTMISEFISFFTKSKDTIIDPFCGIGATLVACDRTKRKGIGIEINKKYFKISKARTKQKVINGNSKEIDKILTKNKIKNINFCITSPPYWNVLHRSTGNYKEKRLNKNLDVKYSTNHSDIGNIEDYEIFIDELFSIFLKLKDFMKKNAYLVVILKNVKKGGKNYPLAWDFAKKMSSIYTLRDEKIWCQDKVSLSPYGYPFAYTTNIHHHYCLVFRNSAEP